MNYISCCNTYINGAVNGLKATNILCGVQFHNHGCRKAPFTAQLVSGRLATSLPPATSTAAVATTAPAAVATAAAVIITGSTAASAAATVSRRYRLLPLLLPFSLLSPWTW